MVEDEATALVEEADPVVDVRVKVLLTPASPLVRSCGRGTRPVAPMAVIDLDVELFIGYGVVGPWAAARSTSAPAMRRP